MVVCSKEMFFHQEQLSILTKHRLTWRKHELCHFEGFSWTPPEYSSRPPYWSQRKPSQTPRQKPMENRFWDVLGHSSGSYAPFWMILRQSGELFSVKGILPLSRSAVKATQIHPLRMVVCSKEMFFHQEQLSTLTKHRLTWRKHELCHFAGLLLNPAPAQNIHPGFPIDPKGSQARHPTKNRWKTGFGTFWVIARDPTLRSGLLYSDNLGIGF